MHLLVLPETGGGKSIDDPRVPDFGGLPAFSGHGRKWGQRSSMQFGVTRGRLVAVSGVTRSDIDDLLAAVPMARYKGECCKDTDAAKMHAALSTKSPRFDEWCAKRTESFAELRAGRIDAARRCLDALDVIGKTDIAFHRGPANDWIGAGREIVAACEEDERRAIYALTTLHSDDFNRADASLNGVTMSDGVGAWTVHVGAFSVVSNQAKSGGGGGGGDADVYDSVMSAVAEQRSLVVSQSAAGGPLSRYTADAAGTGYLAYRGGGSALVLLRANSVVAALYTQLGSTGSTVSNGNTVAADSDSGTNQSALLNGVVDVGPVSDATFASGRAGMYGATNAILDDFVDSIASVASSRIGARTMQIPNFGRVGVRG